MKEASSVPCGGLDFCHKNKKKYKGKYTLRFSRVKWMHIVAAKPHPTKPDWVRFGGDTLLDCFHIRKNDLMTETETHMYEKRAHYRRTQ